MIVSEADALKLECVQSDRLMCISTRCMAWRWLQLSCDPDWVAAVRKAAEDLGDKSGSKTKAAAHVNANRKQYGLTEAPFRGYCGLAGKPEA